MDELLAVIAELGLELHPDRISTVASRDISVPGNVVERSLVAMAPPMVAFLVMSLEPIDLMLSRSTFGRTALPVLMTSSSVTIAPNSANLSFLWNLWSSSIDASDIISLPIFFEGYESGRVIRNVPPAQSSASG